MHVKLSLETSGFPESAAAELTIRD